MINEKSHTGQNNKKNEKGQYTSVVKAITLTAEGEPYPLGVSVCGDRFNFAVYADEASSCFLKIYFPGEKEAFINLMMYKNRDYSSIFTLSVKIDFYRFNASDDCATFFEYMYEADEVQFTDRYAKRITGHSQFGKKAGYLRGCVEKNDYNWGTDRHLEIDFSDMVIYKLNIRSFTMHASSGARYKGTYSGAAGKIKSMQAVGINAVLLMPCIEFNEIMDTGRINCWGFGADTFYFAPKASYAMNPDNCCTEFKNMVKKFHSAGIEVLLEMDFNSITDKIMIIDCLRYWVREYHIDGFRLYADNETAYLAAADAYLKNTKLLYEKWDISRLFAAKVLPKTKRLAVCNNDFMVNTRQFLKGDNGFLGAMADRIRDNDDSLARVNYIADHNGFTLRDTYSYDVRHNEINGEKNADGMEINYCWNCGAEGETTQKSINRLRQKMIENAMTVLLLSQGTPMIMAGDELANSQYGNNNAYCVDNECGWVKWNNGSLGKKLKQFTRDLLNIRKLHGVFHNEKALKCMDYLRIGNPDISFHGTKPWFPNYDYSEHTMGIMLNGQYADDKSIYVVFNMHWEQHEFELPDCPTGSWKLVTATDWTINEISERCFKLSARSIAVFAG